MFDRIFAPALAFLVLTGATLAIATAWFDSRSTVQTVRLPSVEIVVARTLPPTRLASNANAQASASVQ
jgi:hypothetical protein